MIVLLLSCNNQENNPFENTSYAFFVAGHTYGKPETEAKGLHQPFVHIFDYLNELLLLKHGVLTGDVVKSSSKANWDVVKKDLEGLRISVEIAPGNHDLNNIDSFKNLIGSTYKYYYLNDDLFILLSPFETGWNIEGEQKEMLDQAIAENLNNLNRIFIFMHQPIWAEETNQYESCPPNSWDGKNGASNFWSVIFPILDALPNEVVLFSGDHGATETACPIVYDKIDNIQFIGSGMGIGQQDNIVITKIQSDGSMQFQLIALNKNDISHLGNVEDYWVQ